MSKQFMAWFNLLSEGWHTEEDERHVKRLTREVVMERAS